MGDPRELAQRIARVLEEDACAHDDGIVEWALRVVYPTEITADDLRSVAAILRGAQESGGAE